MKKIIFTIASIIAILTSFSSCLGDVVEYEYSDEAAIASFQLGTLNQYLVTPAQDGSDSTYMQTVDCSGYSFNIDHQKGLVWNTDSLPYGIDAAKVICTVSARNGGGIGIKSLTSDSINVYNETDSIDFTAERTFVVYSPSLRGKREYAVKVNVHQEYGDTCIWTLMNDDNADLMAMTDMKAVAMNGTLYLYGNVDGETRLYTSATNDGIVWAAATLSPALDAAAPKSMIAHDNRLYTISGGELLSSLDGANWNSISATTLRQLVAASTKHLYALSAENKLMSSADNGATWSEEEIDDDAALLPTESVAYVTRPVLTNVKTERIVLVGNRDLETFPDDTTAVVWTKYDEYAEGARSYAWNYIDFTSSSLVKAPRCKNWQIIGYDDNNIKALVGEPEGQTDFEALSCFLNSSDNGITWREDTIMMVPDLKYLEGENLNKSFAMTVDENQMVWIFWAQSGQIWKGRINRVAWKKDE